jgi:hypothetical protein
VALGPGLWQKIGKPFDKNFTITIVPEDLSSFYLRIMIPRVAGKKTGRI